MWCGAGEGQRRRQHAHTLSTWPPSCAMRLRATGRQERRTQVALVRKRGLSATCVPLERGGALAAVSRTRGAALTLPRTGVHMLVGCAPHMRCVGSHAAVRGGVRCGVNDTTAHHPPGFLHTARRERCGGRPPPTPPSAQSPRAHAQMPTSCMGGGPPCRRHHPGPQAPRAAYPSAALDRRRKGMLQLARRARRPDLQWPASPVGRAPTHHVPQAVASAACCRPWRASVRPPRNRRGGAGGWG